MALVETAPMVGRTIAGKFVVEELIGKGAMGAVYRARQLALDKVVAIKVLHQEHTRDPTFSARFQREAKAASRLDHPNSMRVIDYGEDGDLLYIAMEYLNGRDLFHVLQQDWPFAQGRAAGIVTQILAALAVAHDMGVVHRDLKPENIMVLRGTDDEGRPCDVVKVCDFGIAKITEAPRTDPQAPALPALPGQKLTTQGIVVGTPEYMSPEQGKGESLDARSDLYSVGVILYQLLTGRVPFDGESAIGIVLRHVTEEPASPSSVNPNVDPRVEAICLRAMQKKKEARYQTAREMRSDLRVFLSGGSPSMRPHDSRRSSPLPFETAATVHAGELHLKKTPSKATPAGTVAVALERPRRSGTSAVIVVAGGVALLAGLVGTLVAKRVEVKTSHTQAAEPPKAASAPIAPSIQPSSTQHGIDKGVVVPAEDVPLLATPPPTTQPDTAENHPPPPHSPSHHAAPEKDDSPEPQAATPPASAAPAVVDASTPPAKAPAPQPSAKPAAAEKQEKPGKPAPAQEKN